MSTQKRSDEDFARELASHLELETEQQIADGLAPDAARTAARRDFGNVTAARERFYEARRAALARPPGAGRPLRRAQHAARARRGPRRRRVARRRHRRHHRHADGPGRRLSQAAPALPRSGTALARADRQPGPRRCGGSEAPPPAALYRTWRDAFGSSIAATTAQPGLRDLRAGDRTDTAPSRAVTPEFFALLGIRAHLGETALVAAPGADSAPRAILSYGVVAAALRRARRRRRASRLDRQPAAHDHRRPARALLVLGHELADLDAARRAGAAARSKGSE